MANISYELVCFGGHGTRLRYCCGTYRSDRLFTSGRTVFTLVVLYGPDEPMYRSSASPQARAETKSRHQTRLSIIFSISRPLYLVSCAISSCLARIFALRACCSVWRVLTWSMLSTKKRSKPQQSLALVLDMTQNARGVCSPMKIASSSSTITSPPDRPGLRSAFFIAIQNTSLKRVNPESLL